MTTVSGLPPTLPVPESFVDEQADGAYDYEVFVIGGGSGGLACAKACAALGQKTGIADFVKASPQGTTWGLGGTCVNVGCIPKKLMHTAAIHGHNLEDAGAFGWHPKGAEPGEANGVREAAEHDWGTMVQNIRMHIKSLNFGYRSTLSSADVMYHNALARLVDPHTVELTKKTGDKETKTAKRIVIAVGGRPTLPEMEGIEHAITSDDIFFLPNDPKKTLCVGASYVSLECAGFLTGIGKDVTVAIRSIPLRGFDQQMAEKIVDHMEIHNTKFLKTTIPTKIEKQEDGRLKVSFQNSTDGSTFEDTFDTVMYATGRSPDTKGLGCVELGMQLSKGGRVIVDGGDRTSIPNIYAIGDVVEGGLELTPVAIKAGKLLADRLFKNGKTMMDYRRVPTTVFTPLEYGACGMMQEEVVEKFGPLGEKAEGYHSAFTPLEWTVPHRDTDLCFCKIFTVKDDEGVERLVGWHYVGPNAGEITQAVAPLIRLRASKEDLDSTIGIHPTIAEELTLMNITISSGDSPNKGGC